MDVETITKQIDLKKALLAQMKAKFHEHRTRAYQYAKDHSMSYQGFNIRALIRNQPNPFLDEWERKARRRSWLTIDEALQSERMEEHHRMVMHEFVQKCRKRHEIDRHIWITPAII